MDHEQENIALIRFVRGFTEDGVSADGLPHYRQSIRIIKDVPPLTRVEYEATEEDFDNPEFEDAVKVFKRQEKARQTPIGVEGFPLILWAAVGPAEFNMCAAREIVTVEQLAAKAGNKKLPGEIQELAERARQMVAHARNVGKFEAIIRIKDGEIEALQEQVRELRAAVSGRDAMIDQMRQSPFLFPQAGGTVHGQ